MLLLIGLPAPPAPEPHLPIGRPTIEPTIHSAALKAKEVADEAAQLKARKAAAGGRAFAGGDCPPKGGLAATLRSSGRPKHANDVIVTDVVLVMPDAPPPRPKTGEGAGANGGGSKGKDKGAKGKGKGGGGGGDGDGDDDGQPVDKVGDAKARLLAEGAAERARLNMVGAVRRAIADACIDRSMFAAHVAEVELAAVGMPKQGGQDGGTAEIRKQAAAAAAAMAAARESRQVLAGPWAPPVDADVAGAEEGGGSNSPPPPPPLPSVFAAYAAAARRLGDSAPEQGTTESEVLLLCVEAVVASCGGSAGGDGGAWGADGERGVDVAGPWLVAGASDEASSLQAAAVTQWGEELQAAAFFNAARARAARTSRLWGSTQVPGARGRHWPALPQRPSLTAAERGTRATEVRGGPFWLVALLGSAFLCGPVV